MPALLFSKMTLQKVLVIFSILIWNRSECAHAGETQNSNQQRRDTPLISRIGNDALTVSIYLPDAKNGFYRGTRFDWSGMITKASYDGHQYFVDWQSSTFPAVNCAAGPAEEFDMGGSGTLPLGYIEAAAGEVFLKIGVGWLRKGTEKEYSSFIPYELVQPGEWKTKRKKNSITWRHRIPEIYGYRYDYRKQIVVDTKKRTMIVRHWLTNSGAKPFTTTTYCHNFVQIDKSEIGPDYDLTLSNDSPSKLPSPLENRSSNTIGFTQNLKGSVEATLGVSESLAKGLSWTITNKRTGGRLLFTTNTTLEKSVLYAEKEVLCVEPHLRIVLPSGYRTYWEWRYTFQPDQKIVTPKAPID